MVEPDDHDDQFDLEPVLNQAVETMRHKAMQVLEGTQGMRRKYQEDAVQLDGCVARAATNV